MTRPATVLLPTTRWTAACDDVAAQLTGEDELLVICDDERDPVTRHDDLPDGTEIVVAGEPSGCSGKANAIDAGMERATNDLLVWTDDDFDHPPEWLDTLRADYERHGPVSEVPFFVGRDPLAVLLEPAYGFGGTFGTWAANVPWGGAVTFDRSDLDVEAFRGDLRRTISDDGVLGDHLDVTTLRRTRRVEAGGSIRESLERYVRFQKIVRFHAPGMAVGNLLAGALATAFCLLFPLTAFLLLTVGYGALYAGFGRRRPSFLLAYPATLTILPLMVYAHARRTFVWGGRRYRWRRKFDVEIVV